MPDIFAAMILIGALLTPNVWFHLTRKVKEHKMKRAGYLMLLTTALATTGSFFAANAVARDNLPQACAEAAYEKTGESSFKIEDYQNLHPGYSRHEITLTAKGSSKRVVCLMRYGRVTKIDIQEAAPIHNPVIVS